MTAAKRRTEKKVANVATEAEVVEYIRQEFDKRKSAARERGDKKAFSLRDFADEIGVTPAYLSDIIMKEPPRREPGPKVLDYFGIGKTTRRVVEYVFFRK